MSETVIFPRLDQDMVEGTIAAWLVEVGDEVRMGEEIAEIETDKVVASVESPADGVVLAILADEGKVVPVGEPIVVIGEEGEELPEEATAARAANQDGRHSQAEKRVVRERIDTKRAPIESRDMLLPVDRSSWPRPHDTSPRSRYDAHAQGESWKTILQEPKDERMRAERAQPAHRREDGQRVELSSIRRATVRTVEASWQIPQFSVEAEVRTDAMRRALEEVERLAPTAKVTITDMLIAAMAKATRRVPEVNAWFEGNAIRYFEEVDLSLMVNSDRGLYVPVIRSVQQIGLAQIAKQRQQLVAAAQEGALSQEQLEPGTIALSNLGMFQIRRFNALLFPPQVAILAVGRARSDVAGEPMWLTLTVDHRAVDGATAARYLEELQRLLADPILLLV